jgi:hypothetical protein
MDNGVGDFIATVISLLPIFGYLGYVLYFRVQARPLEFMLTLIVSSVPIGLLLNANQSVREVRWYVDFEKIILIGAFPALIIFGESLWGLSAAKRLNVQGTWRRLALLVLGWLILPSLAAMIAPFFYLNFDFFVGSPGVSPLILTCLAGAVVIALVLLVEWNCKLKRDAEHIH